MSKNQRNDALTNIFLIFLDIGHIYMDDLFFEGALNSKNINCKYTFCDIYSTNYDANYSFLTRNFVVHCYNLK